MNPATLPVGNVPSLLEQGSLAPPLKVLLVLTLPLTLVTLGLFLFVLNALCLWMTSALVPGFAVRGFWAAFWGALVVTLVSWAANAFLSDRGRVTVITAREDAKDSLGVREWTGRWADFLDRAAAKAPTPDARAVFDSHRLSASLDLGDPHDGQASGDLGVVATADLDFALLHGDLYLLAANWPRSFFTNRDSFPLVAISRMIAL